MTSLVSFILLIVMCFPVASGKAYQAWLDDFNKGRNLYTEKKEKDNANKD
jgi:hypothetical protein